MAVVIALLVAVGILNPGEKSIRIGAIHIVGNTDTPACVILHLVDLHPGQKLNSPNLARAAQRLRASRLFKSNPWHGTGPTVQAIPNEFDREFVEILVTVAERPGNWFRFGLLSMADAAFRLDGAAFCDDVKRLCRRASEVLLQQ